VTTVGYPSDSLASCISLLFARRRYECQTCGQYSYSCVVDIVYDGSINRDVFIVAGDRLSFTCQLNANSSVNCSPPFFTRSSRQSLDDHVQQRTASQSAVELVIEHVSVDDSGSYFCYIGNDPSPTSGITVTVTSRPHCIILQHENV